MTAPRESGRHANSRETLSRPATCAEIAPGREGAAAGPSKLFRGKMVIDRRLGESTQKRTLAFSKVSTILEARPFFLAMSTAKYAGG